MRAHLDLCYLLYKYEDNSVLGPYLDRKMIPRHGETFPVIESNL